MNRQPQPMYFESSQPFQSERIHAAAVYCSDGRYGEQFDDFFHNALHLPRYDRLAVPGGAACLAGHFANFFEEQAVVKQLQFLIEVHKLHRVVLVAHQDCAYYKERLHVAGDDLEVRQRADLIKAVKSVRALNDTLDILAFFARCRAATIGFEPVELS